MVRITKTTFSDTRKIVLMGTPENDFFMDDVYLQDPENVKKNLSFSRFVSGVIFRDLPGMN